LRLNVICCFFIPWIHCWTAKNLYS